MTIKRGDIYYADLNGTVGSEQGGIRPVLIVQNDIGNVHSPTVIAAPVTSKPKKGIPTHVELTPIESGLPKLSQAMLEQLRTIDKKRLKAKLGEIRGKKLAEVDTAMMISLGIE